MATRVTLAHGVGGGMERHTDTLASGLVSRGHDVTVVTTSHPDGRLSDDAGGVRWAYVRDSTWRRYERSWWSASWDELRRSHASRPYDVVLSQSAGALGYLRRARAELGVPSVVVLHGSPGGDLLAAWRGARAPRGVYRLARQGWRLPPLRARWREAVASVERWVAVSPEVAARNSRELGIPADRLTVIPPGVDVLRFRPCPEGGMALRRELGIPPDAPVVSVATRLEAGKGVDVALEAVSRLQARCRPARLLVAGDGHLRRALQRRAERLGLGQTVRFLGFVDHDHLPALLAASDLFLMPSVLPEGFPVSVVEAMAAGVPVVAADTAGVRAAVDDGRTGLLVRRADPTALAGAVVALLDDDARRRAMGRAGREHASAQLSSEAMLDSFEEALASSALERARGPGRG